MNRDRERAQLEKTVRDAEAELDATKTLAAVPDRGEAAAAGEGGAAGGRGRRG
jgi:hypothetical protein